jgi:hypothetical protein
MAFGIFQLIVAIGLMLAESERIRRCNPCAIFISSTDLHHPERRTRSGQKLRASPAALGSRFHPVGCRNVLCPAKLIGSATSNVLVNCEESMAASLRLDPCEHAPDAYFAAGPDYMRRPGNDYHSFRALANGACWPILPKIRRSPPKCRTLPLQPLARSPSQRDWEYFTPADYERLKARFGINLF